MGRGVYRFYWDCGRMGELTGVFVAEEKAVKKHIGADIYFGEVLGKHSEIFGTLDEGDLELLETEPVFVSKFEEIFPHGTGYNPLNYLREDR